MPLNLGTFRFTHRAQPTEVSPRSRRVRFSKKMLAVIALVLFIAIVIIAWLNGGGSNRLVLSGSSNKPADTSAKMQRPRYFGVDSKNRPYTVTADVAAQQTDGSIDLEHLNADMMLKDSAWLSLNALHGKLQPEAQQIELTQDVQMFYEGGYEFRSNHALVNMRDGTVTGTQPIEGQGPSGIIKSNRFEILDRGDVLKFMENVRVTLYVD